MNFADYASHLTNFHCAYLYRQDLPAKRYYLKLQFKKKFKKPFYLRSFTIFHFKPLLFYLNKKFTFLHT